MAQVLANKVVLVTGASAGIGAATAMRLARAGARVFGTSRNPQAEPPAPGIAMLALDVGDAQSVATVVGAVIREAGRIDALVNNAGFGIAGAVEDTTIEEMVRQLDTNLLGAVRVIQAVLPHMRAQRSGRIVQISSLAARIGIPFQGAYCASKAALSRLGEALGIEVAPFGIQVVMIEPGDVATNFTAARQWTGTGKTSHVYGARARHAVAVMEKSERKGAQADRVARLVEIALAAEKPKLCYVAAGAAERQMLILQRLVSGRLFESLIRSSYEPQSP